MLNISIGAVLMSGSSGYSNYRHQSDILTLTRILRNNNISTKTILYDDIAYNIKNPYKGKIFNDYCHQNVYDSTLIDYSGSNTTFETLKAVFGEMADRKFDTLLLYYSDHGAPGLLCIPNKCSSSIHKDIYTDDILNMLRNASRKVKRIFVILESCYSGSIAKEIKIPGVTILAAANNVQSSYSKNYDDSIGTFLTNEFTSIIINLLRQIKKTDTIRDFVNNVMKMTTRSNVVCYGDTDKFNNPVEYIFGVRNVAYDASDRCYGLKTNNYVVNSYETYEFSLRKNYEKSLRFGVESMISYWANKLDKLEERKELSQYRLNLLNRMNYKRKDRIKKFEKYDDKLICYKDTVLKWKQQCKSFGEFEQQHIVPKLFELCDNYVSRDIFDALDLVCNISI